MKKIIALIIGILAIAIGTEAQNFNLSKFTNASGLPQNYVYSIVQDDNGFIWIGMGEGLSHYDGVRFQNYTVRDSLSDNYVSRMLIDTDGNLWCGHGNGTFTYYNGRKFTKIPANEEMTAPIRSMCLDDRGNIWAVEQNMGIVKISPDHKLTTYFDEEKFGSRIYTSICAVNSMVLLVGTTDGLMVVKVDVDGDTLHDPEEVDDIPMSAVNCIKPTLHGQDFWICQEDGGIFRYSPTNGVRDINQCNLICRQGDERTYDIRSIYEDANGDLYVGTWGEGVKKLKYRSVTDDYLESLSLNEENGLGNNYVADITVDREGIFWFATYGGGVVAWINNYFSQYNIQDIGLIRTKIISAQVNKERLWLGTNDGLINMSIDCMSDFEYYSASSGIPEHTDITKIIFDDKHKTQYIGTNGQGVYYKHYDDTKYQALENKAAQEVQKIVNDMTIDDTCLYLATQGGLITYSLKHKNFREYTTNNGLPHNNINFVQLDQEGELWLGPKNSGIAMLEHNGWFNVQRLANVPVDVADMTIDDRGRFWLATVNNGILCSSNDTVTSITVADGLEKNYCFGIECDENGHIWVCHQPGLSCIDLNNGSIRTYNLSNGVTQEFNSVEIDEKGDLWFASYTGVLHYISEYDKCNLGAPIMNLTNVVISGKRHSVYEDINLPYPYMRNPDKLEFNFVGISMKDPLNVSYEYWLQKGEEDNDANWMPLGTQNHKEFDYLPEGDYILNIRAFNSSGIVSQRPLRIRIHIDMPFWKQFWFPIVAIILLIIIVRKYSQWREEKLLREAAELKEKIDNATREINDQKNVIEQKNKDIESSIEYAKRIQLSVLPPRDNLKDFPFADSFLMFRPRDIVSGDFYWFNRYGDHVLICCADCTGHGVPGAFMTLIGTTILNDATRDPEMRHPGNLLRKLDKELKMTVNKNTTVEMRDGMDCSIIDIDLTTGTMISAAAKRPIFIIHKGILSQIKGTRRAIGDVWNDNEFLETTTQLNEGDCIYMFSDGYTDQLGSMPDNETTTDEEIKEEDAIKLSTNRLRTLLESICNESMEDQQTKLELFYDKWRHQLSAVDDVIMMGIRFKLLNKEE